MKAKPTKSRGVRGGEKTAGRKRGRIRIQRNQAGGSSEIGRALAEMDSWHASGLTRGFRSLFADLAKFSKRSPKAASSVCGEVGRSFLSWVETLSFFDEEFEKAAQDFLAECYKLHRKRLATPDRKTVRERRKFRQTASAAVWEVVILHDAGWHRHWSVNQPFPKVRFGSQNPGDRRQWQQWISVFFAAQMSTQGIFGREGTKSAMGVGRGRNIVLKEIFDQIYTLVDEWPDIRAVVLVGFDSLCCKQGAKDGMTFLECMTNRYPECVNIS